MACNFSVSFFQNLQKAMTKLPSLVDYGCDNASTGIVVIADLLQEQSVPRGQNTVSEGHSLLCFTSLHVVSIVDCMESNKTMIIF